MILVTGATGLVGSHLLYYLTSNQQVVRALHRESSDLSIVKKTFSYYTREVDELWEKIEWVKGDLLDIQSTLDILEGVNKVYHTAAHVSFNPAERARTLRVNVEGTANLVNACLEKHVKRLCHASSTAALGNPTPGNPTNESCAWKPGKGQSTYSISKIRSELEVWRGFEEGLEGIIVNPSVILGPGDWSKGSPAIIRTIANGLRFYTRGVTGFVDVHDVAQAMIQLMNSPISGERYVLSAENISYEKLFGMIARSLECPVPDLYASPTLGNIAWRFEWLRAKATGKPPLITRETVSAGQNTTYFSSKKIEETLGFVFTPIKESVEKTCKIYKAETPTTHI
jgi:dihydroflavonol-4-reductase